ncbi:hypothetical protein RF11_05325 [Thelohanellus kitauei]|uniref:Uncharacterized protein n=1 Tax=Thelohanellus kitauei TaxID=669202 RepID=A0A0C2MJP3_THEKT|nr:hypothetical protein RF11_05325 [Thelohanellus kitauei]
MNAILGNDFLSATNAIIIPRDGRLTFENLVHPRIYFSDTDLKVGDDEKLNKLLKNFYDVIAQHKWDLGDIPESILALIPMNIGQLYPDVTQSPKLLNKKLKVKYPKCLNEKLLGKAKAHTDPLYYKLTNCISSKGCVLTIGH